MAIRLAEGLSLPNDAATQVFAFMGRRGSGKTYGAGRLVEQLHARGDQVVVMDPVGTWWGLRLAADGKSPGLEVPVFGGEHGDIPLEATAGKVVAELVAERGTSLVLDVSSFTLRDQRRFVGDFATELFHAKKRHRSPLMVVFEEAQEFVPQHVRGDVALMVGALERLVKLGRNYGVGAAMLSQRPQSVNKDVLNLAEVLLAFQLVGPQERKAIQGWVQEKGTQGREEVADELPALAEGTALIWSPQWLRHFGKHKLLPKKTFDASATPTAGTTRVTASLAPIDLEAVRRAMAATIEQARANDPGALKAEVARLRRELEAARKSPASRKPVEVRVEVPTVPPAMAASLRQLHTFVIDAKAACEQLLKVATEAPTRRVASAGRSAVSAGDNLPSPTIGRLPKAAPQASSPTRPPRGTAADSEHSLSRAAQSVLTALAQLGGQASDSHLSALSGYRITSSSFNNALSELRVDGLLSGPPGDRTLTEKGRARSLDVPPAPTGRELLTWWLLGRNARGRSRLSKAGGAVLQALYHGTLSRQRLSDITGYSTTSSSFNNAISEVRTLKLAGGPNGGALTIADVFQSGADRARGAEAAF